MILNSHLNLFSKSTIKNLLKEKGIKPSKRIGQNFLISKKVLKKILKASDLKSKDFILEIGPGIGTLTLELTKRAKWVIAVEKDKRMVEILKETTKDFKNLKIVQGDILKMDLKKLNLKKYKVVANIPYYLTSPLIKKFLESENPPEKMILMVQKEVGERICALPPKTNLLAVSVQFFSKPEIFSFVSKGNFWPKPKVDSVILKIVPRQFRLSRQFCEIFFRIVRAGFSHPRKKLVNNLSFKLKLEKEKIKKWLSKSRIDEKLRGENLSLENWISLTENYFDIIK